MAVQATNEAVKAAPAVAEAAWLFKGNLMNSKNRNLRGMSSALFDSDLIASRLALFLAEALWASLVATGHLDRDFAAAYTAAKEYRS